MEMESLSSKSSENHQQSTSTTCEDHISGDHADKTVVMLTSTSSTLTSLSTLSICDDSSSYAYCRSSSQISSSSSSSAFTEHEDTNNNNSTFKDNNDPSHHPLCWPVSKSLNRNQSFFLRRRKRLMSNKQDDQPETNNENHDRMDEKVVPNNHTTITQEEEISNLSSELEMMKERFSKLLLGEDMSGGGKGVCTAIAISNAITNLYATVFGHNLRLEPLSPEKKLMWRKEMDCLLSVCDYIVEFIASSQMFQDGNILEVMTNRPRVDIYINLPALQKLDAMLLEVLENFKDREFWYIEQGSVSSSSSNSGGSFRKVIHPKEDKWWLPVPCVPTPNGLSEKYRKDLQQKRDSANQIHKAAMAINNSILSDMQVPEAYMASLPKNGRASLGDSIYRYMILTSSEKFSPDYLLDCLSITTEHEALEMADRVEASMYAWRRKACLSYSKSSWKLVKDIISDTDKTDKNHILAGRAENVLLCLKQRHPEMPQTTLDTCKIQFNRDVGQAILESYSRVLEGLAFNIVAWIDDVLYIDSARKCQS